eukprot:TRINITY_DN3733_c0_g2_i2.p1 TRINITY_DN3733_c0_g2~~TRINITY_DN3733_c0_g2_i2.p1  ORF type:complete len:673 (-),score=199.77 TRINITY_DN3733_c0_g2_i2:508-2526(-)
MIRRPPRSTLSSSSAASDVYKRQVSTQSTGVWQPTSTARQSYAGMEAQGASAERDERPYQALEDITLYETASYFYLVGRQASGNWRILKVARTLGLHLSCDAMLYSRRQLDETLNALHVLNLAEGGMTSRGSVLGVLGFIKLWEGYYYMYVVTESRVVGNIGDNQVMAINETALVKLAPAVRDSAFSREDDVIEKRYKTLLLGVDLSKECYYSPTYDLSRTVQHNSTHCKTQNKFVWNHHLLHPYHQQLQPEDPGWTLTVVHGYFEQCLFSIEERQFSLALLSRRSRFYAGTRYLKRGMNDSAQCANEVETEQIVQHSHSELHPVAVTAFVQLRSSIPLFWGHNFATLKMAKIPIQVNKVDPLFKATAMHFNDMEARYGNPIVVWNLIKQGDVREAQLGVLFKQACAMVNRSRAPESQLLYTAIDFKQVSREEKSVLSYLEASVGGAAQIVARINHFHGESVAVPRTEFVPLAAQSGALRTNCIDCLDRTNVSMYVAAKCALIEQLSSLGIASPEVINPKADLFEHLMNLWEQNGNAIALQYGGSTAHAGAFAKERGVWTVSRTGVKVLTDTQRWISNNFTDADKQEAMNLFLGTFQPDRASAHLWDLESDHSLHNTPDLTAQPSVASDDYAQVGQLEASAGQHAAAAECAPGCAGLATLLHFRSTQLEAHC